MVSFLFFNINCFIIFIRINRSNEESSTFSIINTLLKTLAVIHFRWLEVKNWLMHSKKKLALANKRHWKRYWVTLRGTTLMFYSCDDQVAIYYDWLVRSTSDSLAQ